MTPSSKDFSGTPVATWKICSPGNLRVRRVNSTKAILTWDEPYATCDLCPDAVGYEVFGEGIATTSVTRPPCEITGLKADVEYLFYVTAMAAGNNVSTPSPYHLFKLLAPNKPGIPELTDLSHTSMTITWAPSTDNGGNIRYRVYLNGFLIAQVDQPHFSLTHLRSHTEYRVEVRAVNEAGVSEPACETFRTLLRPPTNLRFNHLNGVCRLAWDPTFLKQPAHEVSINGRVFTAAAGRLGYNFRLADLSPGPAPHHFKFVVRAQLDGAVSEESTLEKTLSDGVPPSQPGTPVVSDITDKSATLTWEPSSDNVGVTGYRVVLNGLLPFSAADTHFTFNGLISGAYHYARVFARDKDGNLSTPSSSVVFKTTGQAPVPPPAAPSVDITAQTSTSARLSWIFNEGTPAAGVRIMINDEHYRDILLLPGMVLQNLIPGVEYSISVSAFDPFGQLSEPATLVYESKDVTPPSVPGNLSRTAVTADSVKLTWEASTDDIGIYEYVIYNNHEYFDSTPLTSYTAVDLQAGTYSFEVCALDLSGNASEAASIVIEITSA